jgi:hypothetical protein
MQDNSLHNFIEDYPCQNDDDIQWKTACRKEFNELVSKARKNQKYGKFFYHQEVFLRYVRQYDRIFNIQATGTGKTGSLINVAEFYKKNRQEGIKRIFVLEPGPPTVEDFKSQIKKLSDPDDYNSENLSNASDKKIAKNNLSRLIKEWYSVMTYQQFCKINFNDKDIEDYYSDCVFFLDEAHKLRKLEDSKGGEMTKAEGEKIYTYLWRVAHIVKRSKFIISSATPMINEIQDMVPLLNLLLPANYQFPLYGEKDRNFYDSLSLEQLEPFFRGKITYIKFMESNLNIVNNGKCLDFFEHQFNFPSKDGGKPILPWKMKIDNNQIVQYETPSANKQTLNKTELKSYASQTKIVFATMDEDGYQLDVYRDLVGKNKGFDVGETTKKNNGFYLKEREVSVFVFPNSMYGTKGFDYYTQKNEYGQRVFKPKPKDTISLNKLFRAEAEESSLNNLKLLSSKFHYYLEKELLASKNEHPGNSFCYLEFVEAGGVILLGMILERFGFEEYSNTSSGFDLQTGKLELSKGKRFALLTSKSANIQNILDIFNSKENRHGEYIQMIIASSLARDGINIKNVLRGYIMTPGWHESGTYQALSRFIRADSHDYLLEENEGEKIRIDVARLASSLPEEEENIKQKGIKGASIDTYLYLLSEQKDIRIKRVLRFMKQTAFDAYLNYDRNTAGRSADYSAINDYSVRKYEIWEADGKPGNTKRHGLADNQGPDKDDYIYNTYHTLYCQNKIQQVKKLILHIISLKEFVYYDEVVRLIKKLKLKFDDYIIDYAIEDLITNRDNLSNKENILLFSIVNRGPIIYSVRQNYTEAKNEPSENLLYIDKPYPEITKVKESVEKLESNLDSLYKEIKDMNKEELANYYIKEQTYDLFKLLLEDSLIKLKEQRLEPINDVVLDLFKYYWLVVDSPEGYLKATRVALSDETKRVQGRKRAEGSKAGLKDLDLNKVKEEADKNRKVYIHFYIKSESTAFAISSIFETPNKNIRVMEDEDKFRDATDAEDYVYNFIFAKYLDSVMEEYRKHKYYATYIYRGGENEELVKRRENFFRIKESAEVKNRGRQCGTFDKDVIRSILKYLDKNNKYKARYEKETKKSKLCKILLEIFREQGLVFETP